MIDINTLRSYKPKELNTYSYNTNSIHRPVYDIGEYLPSLGEFEVEIARISLASITGDVYSIRVKINDSNIYEINISDEYESVFDNFTSEYIEIPSQGEIFDILIEMKCGWNEESHLLSLIDYNSLKSIGEAIDFIQFDSTLYPNLNELFDDFLKNNVFKHSK